MKLTKEEAKKLSILDIAYSLGMDMIKSSRDEYYWREHDSFKINTTKNLFKWYSKDIGGDVIKLVQTVKNVSYVEAMNFLETGEFKKVEIKEIKKEPFIYHLEKYEKEFTNGRKYLKEERKLSDETIDFFLKENLLSLVNRKTKDGYEEEVIVFKYLDKDKKIIGGSLQGIIPNKERYEKKGYLKQIMYNSESNAGFNIEIGKAEKLIFFESSIDMMSYYELNKNKINNTKLISMEGLKEETIARYFVEHIFTIEGNEITKIDLKEASIYLDYIIKSTTYFDEEKNKGVITLSVDNDTSGIDFIKKLQQKGMIFTEELPPKKEEAEKADWNDVLKIKKEDNKNMEKKSRDTKGLKDIWDKITFKVEPTKQITIDEDKKTSELINNEKNKPLENAEEIKKDLDKTRQNKNVETKIGDLPDKQEATPLPDENTSQLLNDLSPNQTQSQLLLNFTIINPNLSTYKQNYHNINDKELKKLNRYSLQIQKVSKWYLDNLSDKKIHYLYKENNNLNQVTLEFKKEHFMHLTGILPLKKGQTAEKTLLDFANGKGEFDNIMISNFGATFDKLQVLPELEEILEANTIYFDNLSSIEKLNKLDLSKALNTTDKNLLLLLKKGETNLIPASLMRVRGNLSLELNKINEKTILGVYREENGKIEQLSINEEYIKDGGKELQKILEKQENALTKNIEQEKREIRNKDITLENNKKIVDDYIKNKNIEGLNQYIKLGIKEFTNSENYKNYLKIMSKFHKYSTRNIHLIYKQNPNATLISGYNDWKNKFERQVKKGEKAISILAPLIINLKDNQGKPILDEDGVQKTTIAFKKVSVFDISQTEGKELPKYIQEIDKEVDGYKKIYIAVKEYAKEKNVKIEFSDLPNQVKGTYNPKTHLITLQKQMSQGQTIKTLFHELAHSQLHQNTQSKLGDEKYAKQELEAESIAYILSSHYGLDTGSYSFGYLNSYMKDINDIDEVLKTIHNKAKELIEKIDTNLEKIKNQALTKDNLQTKIEKIKQQEIKKIENKKENNELEKKFQGNQKIQKT